MHGQLSFDSDAPERAAQQYAEVLADQLRDSKPSELEVRGSTVSVRGGFFRLVLNWNLLLCVTRATIEAIPGPHQVVVRYDIRVTELIVVCCILTAVFVTTAFTSHSGVPVVAGPLLIWVWLFGMNYLITWLRMTSLFKAVAKQVARTG